MDIFNQKTQIFTHLEELSQLANKIDNFRFGKLWKKSFSIGKSKTRPREYRKKAASAAGIRVPINFTKAVTPRKHIPVTTIQKTPVRFCDFCFDSFSFIKFNCHKQEKKQCST